MVTNIQTESPIIDRSREMEAKSWWNLWNTSYRTKDDNDVISTELFTRTAAIINGITRNGTCRVLEVACGAGTLSRKLVSSTYHGLDLSPAAIDIAQQKAVQLSPKSGANTRTYEAVDFHEWPARPEAFDLVVCVDAIAYFRDQRFVVRKFAECLGPQGNLVLTTINPFVYDRIQRTTSVRLESGPVNRCLTRAELHSLVEQAGFTIECSYTIMPRGKLGILRIVNSWRLNHIFGPGFEALLKTFKEYAGLGQYRVIVARKQS
jgi:2-polyprenyl-3-methyl-5-hydroxy-6-metoxy-1,4-benzoquinol methylase